MAEQEKKQTLSQKRKAHRATPCDHCGEMFTTKARSRVEV